MDKRVNGVRDSKLLTERNRELLFHRIADWCSRVVRRRRQPTRSATSWAWLRRRRWPRAAPSKALGARSPTPRWWTASGNFVAPHVSHVEMRVKADRTCLSVAAASVLAKVTRDRHHA
jgi:ribonuclease HII